MTEDERAIRNLIATWYRASEEGDVAKVLTFMSEDVIFLRDANMLAVEQ